MIESGQLLTPEQLKELEIKASKELALSMLFDMPSVMYDTNLLNKLDITQDAPIDFGFLKGKLSELSFDQKMEYAQELYPQFATALNEPNPIYSFASNKANQDNNNAYDQMKALISAYSGKINEPDPVSKKTPLQISQENGNDRVKTCLEDNKHLFPKGRRERIAEAISKQNQSFVSFREQRRERKEKLNTKKSSGELTTDFTEPTTDFAEPKRRLAQRIIDKIRNKPEGMQTETQSLARRFIDKIRHRREGMQTEASVQPEQQKLPTEEPKPDTGQYVQFSTIEPPAEQYIQFTKFTEQITTQPNTPAQTGQDPQHSMGILSGYSRRSQSLPPYTTQTTASVDPQQKDPKQTIQANIDNVKAVFEGLQKPVDPNVNMIYTQITAALRNYNDSQDDHTFSKFSEKISEITRKQDDPKQSASVKPFVGCLEKIKAELIEPNTPKERGQVSRRP